MDSSDLRLLIALLFGIFLAITVLSDLVKRRPKAPRMKVRETGFRRTPPPEAAPRPQQSWKVPRR